MFRWLSSSFLLCRLLGGKAIPGILIHICSFKKSLLKSLTGIRGAAVDTVEFGHEGSRGDYSKRVASLVD